MRRPPQTVVMVGRVDSDSLGAQWGSCNESPWPCPLGLVPSSSAGVCRSYRAPGSRRLALVSCYRTV